MWSRDDIIDGGEWQLRLIGSSPRLLYRDQSLSTVITDDANTTTTAITINPSLHTQEIVDYYLPDKYSCFLRLPVTIRMLTIILFIIYYYCHTYIIALTLSSDFEH